MAEFENEDVTRLKQWWEANGAALVIGVALGLVIILGWQGWGWYQDRQAVAASDIYQQVRQSLAEGNVDDTVLDVVARLKSDYASTPYATRAALDIAAYYVSEKDYEKAVTQLDWAIENAEFDGVRHVARVRKARLLWTHDDAEAALALLDTAHPPAFNALYAELAGDIHAARGDREAAHQAYQRALEYLPGDTPRQPLQNKLADNAPSDEAGAPAEQETSSAS